MRAAAPPEVGVIQVKVADRLLIYPAGRTAMVWYGAGVVLDLLARVGPRLSALLPDDRLLWRYLEGDDAESECARHLRRFQERFGAPPRLNEAPIGRGA